MIGLNGVCIEGYFDSRFERFYINYIGKGGEGDVMYFFGG